MRRIIYLALVLFLMGCGNNDVKYEFNGPQSSPSGSPLSSPASSPSGTVSASPTVSPSPRL